MSDYPDRKRLEDIVKTFRWCEKPFTAKDVAEQFKYETKRPADESLVALLVGKAK